MTILQLALVLAVAVAVAVAMAALLVVLLVLGFLAQLTIIFASTISLLCTLCMLATRFRDLLATSRIYAESDSHWQCFLLLYGSDRCHPLPNRFVPNQCMSIHHYC